VNWFYVLHGQRAGPVSDAQLDELLRSGAITRETLIWRQGMADWQPLHLTRSSDPTLPPIINSQVICAECGRSFPAEDVIRLNNSWVCAGCKPMFLQRLREGAEPSVAAGGFWRWNNQLVTRSGTPLPDRCMRCNAPTNGYRLKRKFYWHPPAYFLFILLNLLIYAVIAMCVRKQATLHIPLCERHRVRRIQGIIACWVGVLTGIGLLIGAASKDSGIMACVGVVLFLGGAIFGAVTGAKVSPVKITNDNIWLKGVNKDFLAGLPEWTGR
jgi:hypothetical protein